MQYHVKGHNNMPASQAFVRHLFVRGLWARMWASMRWHHCKNLNETFLCFIQESGNSQITASSEYRNIMLELSSRLLRPCTQSNIMDEISLIGISVCNDMWSQLWWPTLLLYQGMIDNSITTLVGLELEETVNTKCWIYNNFTRYKFTN